MDLAHFADIASKFAGGSMQTTRSLRQVCGAFRELRYPALSIVVGTSIAYTRGEYTIAAAGGVASCTNGVRYGLFNVIIRADRICVQSTKFTRMVARIIYTYAQLPAHAQLHAQLRPHIQLYYPSLFLYHNPHDCSDICQANSCGCPLQGCPTRRKHKITCKGFDSSLNVREMIMRHGGSFYRFARERGNFDAVFVLDGVEFWGEYSWVRRGARLAGRETEYMPAAAQN